MRTLRTRLLAFSLAIAVMLAGGVSVLAEYEHGGTYSAHIEEPADTGAYEASGTAEAAEQPAPEPETAEQTETDPAAAEPNETDPAETDPAADPDTAPAEEAQTASPAAAAFAGEGRYLPVPASTAILTEGTVAAWDAATDQAGNGGTITTSGDFTITAPINVTGDITFIINSDITLESDIQLGASGAASGGTLTVNPGASLFVDNGFIIQLHANGSAQNHGTINTERLNNFGDITNHSGGEITVRFDIHSTGTITNNGVLTFNDFSFFNGGTFYNNNELNINAGFANNYNTINNAGTVFLSGILWGNPPTGAGTFRGGDVIHMDNPNPPQSGEGWTFDPLFSLYVIESGESVTVRGSNQEPAPSNRALLLQDGSTATLDRVTIIIGFDAVSSIRVTGTATINLGDTVNYLRANGIAPGIWVQQGNTLHINGPGTLTARGGAAGGAGIGAPWVFPAGAGTININNATVYAHGRFGAAGIGGATPVAGGSTTGFQGITINGGRVHATTGSPWVPGLGGSGDGTITLLNNPVIYTNPRPTITFDAQGGSAVANAQAEADGNRLTSLPAEPTRAADIFAGWFTEAAGGEPITAGESGTVFPADTTVYAQWVSLRALSVNMHGGEGGPAFPTNIPQTDWTIPPVTPVPTLAGHTFEGWALAQDGEAVTYVPGGAADVTLHALWNVLGEADVAPTFTAQPADYSVRAGSDVTFTVAATGRPAPAFQWQVSTDGGTSWDGVAGETYAVLTLTGVTLAESGNQYRAVATNTEGYDVSDAATLTVTAAPVPASPPVPMAPDSMAIGRASHPYTLTLRESPAVAAAVAEGVPVQAELSPALRAALADLLGERSGEVAVELATSAATMLGADIGFVTVSVSVSAADAELNSILALYLPALLEEPDAYITVTADLFASGENLGPGGLNRHRITAIHGGRAIGGSLNPATGIFTLRASSAGEFTIAYVESLIRLTMGLNSPVITDLARNAPQQAMDVQPVVQDGRTLIPLRFIANALGADVGWQDAADGSPMTVFVTLNGQTLPLGIGEVTPELAELGMDVPAQITNGRTMVSLRFVSEFFGAEVHWDANTRRIEIISTLTR